MNTDDHDHGHDDDPVMADPLMDWALGERLGGEQPPDLVDAVRARLDQAPVTLPVRRRTTSQLVAAALVLLGVGVVCSVALWPRGDDVPLAPQEPKPVHVDTRTNIAVLPQDTRAVEVSGVHDAQFAELARLRDLEVLVVREPWNESFGLSLKMSAPSEVYHLSAASLGVIAGFTKLRRLELSGVVGVAVFGQHPGGSEGEGRVVGAFAQLERLPLLESLTLRCLDTSDEVLAVLPSLRTLRHLDLSFNHGFGEKGMQAISRARTLRRVSLRGCQQLHGTELTMLASLPELEEVDLSAIDGINWRAGSAELDDAESQAVRGRARRRADRMGMGPSSTTLQALSLVANLRVLDVSGSHYLTGDGLAALGRCTTLRELAASGLREGGGVWVRALPRGLERLEVCGEHDDAFCIAVAERLTNLRDLTLAACDRITDAGVAAVAKMPSLRRLDLRQMRGLTAATIDALAGATQLEALDLRHDDFVTAEHVLRLRGALPKLRTLDTSVAVGDLPQVVRSRQDIEALPAHTRSVLGLSLDDDCLLALARLGKLEELDLSSMFSGNRPATRMTHAGLERLAALPALHTLSLSQEEGLAPAVFEVLPRLRSLRELTCSGMTVTDADLANLAGTPLRALSLKTCSGFGRAGIEAIARAAELRHLDLRGAPISTADLRLLPRALTGICLCNCTGLGPDFGEVLAATLPHLRSIEVAHERRDDPHFLRALQPLRSLRELQVECGDLPAAALDDLRAMPWLETLHLQTVGPIPDATIDALRKLPLKHFSFASF